MKSRIINTLVALALLAVLAVLVARTRAVDFEAHSEIVGLMRQLKQVDAEWNVDVLRSKTGLNTNYDPVASPLPLIESLESALGTKADRFWSAHGDSNTRILAHLATFKGHMDRKVELVDRFKSQNSIMRNSSRYLPQAAQDALGALQGEAGAARAEATTAVEDALTQALVFVNTPDDAIAEQVRARLATLELQAQQLGAAAAEPVRGFAAHVAKVLEQERIGRATLGELAALPTAKAIDELADAHAQEHEKLLISQQNARWMLVAYSVFLLAALGLAGWKLFASYRLLNRTNLELNRTNEQLKESQVYMVQAEKMSALGQMVAGIAHEINTPLAYVKGTFEVLREQVAPVADLAERSQQLAQVLRQPQQSRDPAAASRVARQFDRAAQEVVGSGIVDEMGQLLTDGIHGIEQIAEIVTNLKNFSRLDRAKVSEFSVHEGLESTLMLAKNLLKNRVEVRKEFAADLPRIQCSPSQINQVFLNIITNAVHAMPADRSEPGVITLRTSAEGADMVRVEIQDNGSGIPAEVLPKIFDPFFTTKEIGKGTGMGLSISYKIVQQHGGKIMVDTESGVGTVFSILLPVQARSAEAPAAAAVLAA